jgi:predicted phage tail protein
MKIYGAGGGKGGGGGGGATEATDTLRSNSKARIIDVISEGEIVGLVNAGQGIRFDGVRVQNGDGSLNYNGLKYEVRAGLPTQDYIRGFSDVENEIAVGTQITSSINVEKTITNSDVDYVRATMRIPSLSYQDPINGSITGSSVQFSIWYKSDNNAYLPCYAGGTGYEEFSSITPAKTVKITLACQLQSIMGGFERKNTYVTWYYRSAGSQNWIFGGTQWKTFTNRDNVMIIESSILPENQYEVRTEYVYSFAIRRYATYVTNVVTLSGKSRSPYEVSYVIRKPTSFIQDWTFKIERVTPDAETSNIQNAIYLSRYTEVIEAKMMYSNTALIAFEVDASQFGSQIPKRQYEIDGIKLKIPSNYDPTTRLYSGFWNGTFKVEWSNNPAWVLYDILTNARYGLGSKIIESQIDLASFYDVAKYCDGFVNDGYGGTEPRYTFNYVISEKKKAGELVQFICSAFNAWVVNSGGKLFLMQDKPSDPIQTFHDGNVLDGYFTFSSSGYSSQVSTVRVQWNDPLDNYLPNVEIVENPDAILNGVYNEKEVVAYGCTSRGQARRFGKWTLEMEREMCVFGIGIENYNVSIGDIVNIADSSYAGINIGGRIKSSSLNTLTLDIPYDFKAIYSYEIYIQTEGGIETKIILNPESKTDTITITTNLANPPVIGGSYCISSLEVKPRKFRIVSIKEREDGISFEVTAIEHDSTKYDRIENDAEFKEENYTTFKRGDMLPPFNIALSDEYTYLVNGNTIKTGVIVKWDAPDDNRVQKYLVRYRLNDENWSSFIEAQQAILDIKDSTSGVLKVEVCASGYGMKSPTIRADFTLLGLNDPPENATDLLLNVSSNVVFLSWKRSTDFDVKGYEIRYSANNENPRWEGSSVLTTVGADVTTASFEANVGSYLIKAIDIYENYSIDEIFAINNTTSLDDFNVVETITANPTFAGNKIDTTYITNPGGIILNPTDPSQNIGMYPSFDFGINGVKNIGYYEFQENPLDMSVSTRVKIAAQLKFDEISGYRIRDWKRLDQVKRIDGITGAVNAYMQHSISLDGTTWSEWITFTQTTIRARFLKFRIVLATKEQYSTPIVQEASVLIDMDDRFESAQGLVSGTGGYVCTFKKPFKVLQSIVIDASNMSLSDRYVITQRNTYGFTIEFRKYTNETTYTLISRPFNYLAVGYGITF